MIFDRKGEVAERQTEGDHAPLVAAKPRIMTNGLFNMPMVLPDLAGLLRLSCSPIRHSRTANTWRPVRLVDT
jgi:hypothetical protein